MNLIDQHLHSNHSPDSEEDLGNYFLLPNLAPFFVLTDHHDMDSKSYPNTEPDLAKQRAEITLKNKNNVNILNGIELGYYPNIKDELNNYLASNNFDIILLSLHENRDDDYYTLADYYNSCDEQLKYKYEKEYYEMILESINEIKHANVITHIDYAFRLITLTEERFLRLKPQIMSVLELISNRGLALEINTRSFYEKNNIWMYKYILDWYKDFKNNYISIGSDAHCADMYQYNFADAIEFLLAKGIKYTSVFCKQQQYVYDLSKNEYEQAFLDKFLKY